VDFACNASTQLPEVHIWVHRPAAEYILDLISSTALTHVTSQTIVALSNIFYKIHACAKQNKIGKKLARDQPCPSLFRARAFYVVSHCSRWYNDFNTSEQ